MGRTQSLAATDVPQNRMMPGSTGDGDTANMKVNMQQHEFDGRTCEVKLFKRTPQDKDQFFGINNYQITIQFDKWVRVPKEMADHIESIVETIRVPDPEAPEDETRYVFEDRQRFPLSRRD